MAAVACAIAAERWPTRADHRPTGAIPATRDALVHSYRRLMATTRAVVRDA